MATALTTIDPGTDATIAPSTAGKINRIWRIVASASSNITPKSGENAVLPELVSGSVRNVDIDFGERPVVLARGEALVIGNAGPGSSTVYVEYDVVQ